MKYLLPLAASATLLAPAAYAVDIEVAYAYSSVFDPTFERIMEAFEAAHPDIHVTFRATYEDYEDATNTILREAVADTLPDVSFQALNRQALLVERGIAKPLDPYIAEEDGFETAGYHKAMLDLSTFDGQIYGLPFSVSTPIGFYNMDILRAAGVDTIPTTWDEVVETCQAINAKGDHDAIFWHWDISGNWLLQAAMWSQGVPMIKDGKLNMDNPEGVRALETAKAIFHDCAMKPVSGGDASKQFAAGDLGMFFSSTAYVGFVDRSKLGEWDFVTASYPGIDGAPKALPAGGNSAMLTSGSDDPDVLEAAWQFIKFTTSGEGAGLVVVARVADQGFGLLHRLRIVARTGLRQQGLRLLGVAEAGAAEHHHRVLDAERLLGDVGLEHFQLQADAPRLAPEQEFGVVEGQAVGVGFQGLAAVGVGLQFGPGIGESAFVQVVGSHDSSRKTGRGGSETAKAPCGAFGADQAADRVVIRRACGIRRCGCRSRSGRPG